MVGDANPRPKGETSAGYHPDGRLVEPIRHHSPHLGEACVHCIKYVRSHYKI
jgi:hypothetical protein